MSSHVEKGGNERDILITDYNFGRLYFYDLELNIKRTYTLGFKPGGLCTDNDFIIIIDYDLNIVRWFNLEGVQVKARACNAKDIACLMVDNDVLIMMDSDGNIRLYDREDTYIALYTIPFKLGGVTRFNDWFIFTNTPLQTVSFYDRDFTLVRTYNLPYEPRGITRIDDNLMIAQHNSTNVHIHDIQMTLLRTEVLSGIYKGLHTRYFYHEG